MLEEILLWLLRFSGYRTVRHVRNDPTLKIGSAGLEVRGRGTNHQIDAIADYLVQQPFTNPQRLLVEAKCLKAAAGLTIARNAVGIIKDVSEFWRVRKSSGVRRRPYHYMYALFSSSGFATTTQKYAYAQDIYLIPLHNSRFMKPILDIIWDMAGGESIVPAWWPKGWKLKDFRRAFRKYLELGSLRSGNVDLDIAGVSFPALRQKGEEISFALLGTFSGGFPVFLVPAPGVELGELVDGMLFRPRWDKDSWFLESNNRRLFSFDLPDQLFKMYAQDGVLSPEAAVDMKQREMGRLQVVVAEGDSARIIQLLLDRGWIQMLLNKPK